VVLDPRSPTDCGRALIPTVRHDAHHGVLEMTMKRLMILAAMLAAAACGDDSSEADVDNGNEETDGTRDAGRDAQGGDVEKDAGKGDAGKADAGGGNCDELTYAKFGEAFEEKYCASCHAASVKGTARRAAPPAYVFDTLAEIKQHKDEIKEQVVSKAMPYPFPDVKQPTDDERAKLAAWIDCGPK
jgi:hypothetical protein